MKFDRQTWLVITVLSILTIIGAVLRLYRISISQIWVDESWVAWTIQYDWIRMYLVDVHPGFYYYLVKIATFFLGTSEFGLRFVSLFFGILMIPVAYLLGKELTEKDLVGLIAAGLTTISIEAIQQSQNARMYTEIPALFGLFIVCFLKAYKQGGYKWWGLTTTLAILMLNSWYFSAIPIGITILWFLVKERKKVLDNKPFLWCSIAFVFFMTLLVIPFLRSLALKSTEGSTILFTGPQITLQVITTLLGSPPILAVFIALFAIGGWILLFREDNEIALYLLLVIGGSLVIGTIIGYNMMILARYFDFLSGLLYVLIGFAVCSIPLYFKSKAKSYFVMGFIVILLILSFSITFPDYYTTTHNYSGDQRQYDQDLLNATPNAQEIVMLVNPGSLELFRYYWKGTANIDMFNSFSEGVNLTSKYNVSYVLIPSDPIPKENIEGWKIYTWLSEHANKTVNYRGMDVYKVTNL